MSTESDTQPETALDHPAARSRQKSMSVSAWYEQEGLIPALTPMAYREGDPIDQLQTLSARIDALPDTAALLLALLEVVTTGLRLHQLLVVAELCLRQLVGFVVGD